MVEKVFAVIPTYFGFGLYPPGCIISVGDFGIRFVDGVVELIIHIIRLVEHRNGTALHPLPFGQIITGIVSVFGPQQRDPIIAAIQNIIFAPNHASGRIFNHRPGRGLVLNAVNLVDVAPIDGGEGRGHIRNSRRQSRYNGDAFVCASAARGKGVGGGIPTAALVEVGGLGAIRVLLSIDLVAVERIVHLVAIDFGQGDQLRVRVRVLRVRLRVFFVIFFFGNLNGSFIASPIIKGRKGIAKFDKANDFSVDSSLFFNKVNQGPWLCCQVFIGRHKISLSR